MKNFILSLTLISSIFSILNTNAFSCDIDGHSGFLPENKLSFPIGLKSTGGITEIQFNQIMDKMTRLFSGKVFVLDANFVIERRWSDDTVNAYAHQKNPQAFTIVMFGGLARHPEMTLDGMVMVACHELGHHLGGAPKLAANNKWASNEGQADYWGSMKCLRQYFEGEDQQEALKNLTIPAVVTNKCNAQYINLEERLICTRMSMAAASIGMVVDSLYNNITAPNFTTPDPSVVSQTSDKHPNAQCRMDTIFQAALCTHTIDEAVSNTDANIGVCSIANGDSVGNRPLCWFKP